MLFNYITLAHIKLLLTYFIAISVIWHDAFLFRCESDNIKDKLVAVISKKIIYWLT